nr:MAG TPA: hypothetical protein [Caudoviricetes sp.]
MSSGRDLARDTGNQGGPGQTCAKSAPKFGPACTKSAPPTAGVLDTRLLLASVSERLRQLPAVTPWEHAQLTDAAGKICALIDSLPLRSGAAE